MKKSLLLIALSIIVCSCEIVLEESDMSKVAKTEAATKSIESAPGESDDISFSVSEESARTFVCNFLMADDEAYDLAPVVEGNDTLLFVLNFNDGWKIISGDKRTAPVLAENNDGHFSNEGHLPVPLQIILNDSKEIVLSAQDNNSISAGWAVVDRIYPSSKKTQTRDSDAHWVQVLVSNTSSTGDVETVGHLLNTVWDKTTPWNDKAPVWQNQHCVNEGIAITLAQLMYYHNQMSGSPSSLSENVYLQNPNTLPLLDQIVASNPVNSTRWNSMKKTRQSTTGNSGYVADLIAYISKVIGVNYSIQHSTADIVSATLGYFGLSGQSSVSNGNLSSSFVTTILNNLRNDKPLITVRRTSLSSLPTHTWIIDGFVREQTTYYTTYRFYYVDDPSAISGQYNGYQIVNFYNDEEMASLLPGYTNGSEMVEQSSFETKYFLMNWGLDNGAYDSIRQNVDVWSINGTNYAANYREFYYNISAL